MYKVEQLNNSVNLQFVLTYKGTDVFNHL